MRDIERDNYFMQAAIEEAKKCALLDEVPVGAVVVRDNKIIAASGNGRETYKDPTFHAETEAIRMAAKALGGWRLVGTQQEDDLIPVRPYASIRAAFSVAQTGSQQSAAAVRRESAVQRMHSAPAPGHQVLTHPVQSDSNGNVLVGLSYMRAVYQAFVLDDGFV